MAIISKAFSEVSGTVGFASSVNRVVDDLYTLQAGNIDGSNIAISGIISSNYALSSVFTGAIQDAAINTGKLDFEIFLATEVFS